LAGWVPSSSTSASLECCTSDTSVECRCCVLLGGNGVGLCVPCSPRSSRSRSSRYSLKNVHCK
jgi:hypothetical protein